MVEVHRSAEPLQSLRARPRTDGATGLTLNGFRPKAIHAVLSAAALVLLVGLVPMSPLQDAATGATVDVLVTTQPVMWVVFAPLFGVWDTLSLLTLSQHYAVLVTFVALYLSWRTRARKRLRVEAVGSAPVTWTRMGRAMLREVGRAIVALLMLLAFYAAGMLLPRPMTGVDVRDQDLVAIDFHSHTQYSHDGWSLFTPQRNRAWHEAGGFDVAYVTDHYTWRGYDEAAVDNPDTAGERTVLLEGAEIRIYRRPTNILGSRERYVFALDDDSVFMSPDSIAARYDPESGELPPTLFYTMPGNLIRVVPFSEAVPSGMIGIEINDGSPRGLEQVKGERAEILALADSMDLALIGAANLHGWGRTVASWSLMRIPDWQSMPPEAVGRRIEELLHQERRDAVQVVERRIPYHGGSPVLVAMTLPWVGVAHLRMMSWPERFSWIVWILLVSRIVTRRRDSTQDELQASAALRG